MSAHSQIRAIDLKPKASSHDRLILGPEGLRQSNRRALRAPMSHGLGAGRPMITFAKPMGEIMLIDNSTGRDAGDRTEKNYCAYFQLRSMIAGMEESR